MLAILHILTVIFLGFPIFIFGLYGIILLYFNKRGMKEGSEENGKFEPDVSVIVPTHNEELIISRKINNLLHLDYPKEKLEIIFVDDSDDSTPTVIREYSKKHPNIRLISFPERMGYSPSMVAGCKAAKAEIIVLTEAPALLDKQAIRNLVRHFRKPNIGAVTGRSIILNEDEEVGKSEKLYLNIANFVRTAETSMDSTFYFKGEASAVRKELTKDLEWCKGTFDTAVALNARQKGYKAIYDQEVKFYEYAPLTHSGRVQQKVIRAANWIKILFRFRNMIFKRKYGKFGFIILPMQIAMLIIAPFSIFMGVMLLFVSIFFDLTFSCIIWIILGSLFLSSLIFSKHFAITFLESEYSLLKALYQIIFTKREHDKIEKVISTRR